jgi:hypothetical protein
MRIPELSDERTELEKAELHGYKVSVIWDADDIEVKAAGLSVVLHTAPNTPVKVEANKNYAAGKLVDSTEIVREFTDIGQRWRELVWSRIRRDWGTRSFESDAKGLFYGPYSENGAKRFHCIHCEQTFSGEELQQNYWHCPDPKCGASFLDIFAEDEAES